MGADTAQQINRNNINMQQLLQSSIINISIYMSWIWKSELQKLQDRLESSLKIIYEDKQQRPACIIHYGNIQLMCFNCPRLIPYCSLCFDKQHKCDKPQKIIIKKYLEQEQKFCEQLVRQFLILIDRIEKGKKSSPAKQNISQTTQVIELAKQSIINETNFLSGINQSHKVEYSNMEKDLIKEIKSYIENNQPSLTEIAKNKEFITYLSNCINSYFKRISATEAKRKSQQQKLKNDFIIDIIAKLTSQLQKNTQNQKLLPLTYQQHQEKILKVRRQSRLQLEQLKSKHQAQNQKTKFQMSEYYKSILKSNKEMYTQDKAKLIKQHQQNIVNLKSTISLLQQSNSKLKKQLQQNRALKNRLQTKTVECQTMQGLIQKYQNQDISEIQNRQRCSKKLSIKESNKVAIILPLSRKTLTSRSQIIQIKIASFQKVHAFVNTDLVMEHVQDSSQRSLLQHMTQTDGQNQVQNYKKERDQLRYLYQSLNMKLELSTFWTNLLNPQEKMWLIDALKLQIQSFNTISLIYNASQHDFSSASFHRICGRRKQLLVIIKCRNGNKLGGYTSNELGSPQICKNAFIFTITHRRIMRIKQNKKATVVDAMYGPIFGSDGDIKIRDHKIFSNHHIHNSAYERQLVEGVEVRNILCGSPQTELEDYQVHCLS